MMKTVIFITFSVLAVIKLAIASHLMEDHSNESIDPNSEQKSVEDLIKQHSIAGMPFEIKLGYSTVINSNIQLEEVITAERSPDDKTGESNSSKNESDKVEETDKDQVVKEHEQKFGIQRAAEEEIAVSGIESNTQVTEERDKHSLNNIADEDRNNKDNSEESFQISEHVHRHDLDEDKDFQSIVFAMDPFENESMHRSGAGSASNEDFSKIATSRHGRPDILLGSRRVLNSELLKKKLAAAQALTQIGSSRSFPSDLIQSHVKFINAPMHHPPPQAPSGMYRQSNSRDNPGVYYKDNFPRTPNSQEKNRREYTLDAETNSYPYTPPTSNLIESRPINPPAQTLPPQVPSFYNMFDHNYSPVKNPIYGGGRLKRNAASETVVRPFFRYQLPSVIF